MAASVVAHTSAGSGSGGTTSAINTTGATLLIVASSTYLTPVTLSDSKGNTFTGLTNYVDASSGDLKFFYCSSPVVGAGHTFTYGSTIAACVVAAVNGTPAAATNDFDVGNATGNQPGSATPSHNNEVVFTASNNLTTTGTVDSGFTIIDSVGFNSGVNLGMGLAFLNQGAAAALNPTWSQGVSAAMTAFQTSAAPADTGAFLQFMQRT